MSLTSVSLVARHLGSQDLCTSPGCALLWPHRHRSLPQEPGPAKMAVTSSSSIPSAEKVPTTKSTLWQEEMRAKDQPDGSNLGPAQSPSQSQPSATSTLREPGLESKDGKWELVCPPVLVVSLIALEQASITTQLALRTQGR